MKETVLALYYYPGRLLRCSHQRLSLLTHVFLYALDLNTRNAEFIDEMFTHGFYLSSF